MTLEPLNPPVLGERPRGYSHGMLGEGRILFIAGQVGWDEHERMVSSEFVPQFERALRNILAVLEHAGGQPSDLGRVTIYVTDKNEYIDKVKEVGAAWRQVFGRHFPAMTLVEVKSLLEPGGKVEVEATAVLASGDRGA